MSRVLSKTELNALAVEGGAAVRRPETEAQRLAKAVTKDLGEQLQRMERLHTGLVEGLAERAEQEAAAKAANVALHKALVAAYEQIAEKLEALREQVAEVPEPEPPPAPVPYKFTVSRDVHGRMSEVIATPL